MSSSTKKSAKKPAAKAAKARPEPKAKAKLAPKPNGAVVAETTVADAVVTDPTPKPAKRRRANAKAGPKPKALSCLDAAAVVLKANGDPMPVRGMIEVMRGKGLWTSDAPTPWATLYSAILREIQHKGGDARFVKADRGLFALNPKARA